jgi:Tfp pilus assembly PilM family ATPase
MKFKKFLMKFMEKPIRKHERQPLESSLVDDDWVKTAMVKRSSSRRRKIKGVAVSVAEREVIDELLEVDVGLGGWELNRRCG